MDIRHGWDPFVTQHLEEGRSIDRGYTLAHLWPVFTKRDTAPVSESVHDLR